MHLDHEYSPELIYAALLESGAAWADAEAGAALLEETRRSLVAELKLMTDEKSDAARETAALAAPAYRQHVELMVAARRTANHSKVKYDAVKVLAEARRTEAANRRAEIAFVQGGGAG